MSTEILPCPVCGKPCRWAAALVGVKFFILCAVDCPYGGTSGDTEAAAIAAHNEIAAAVRDHAAVVAERDALRAQVGDAIARLDATTESEGAFICRCSKCLGRRARNAIDSLRSALAATAPKEAPDA